MSKVLAIAWREFKQTVLRKIFLLAVLGMPVLFIAIAAIAGVMMKTQKEPPLVGTVAIVDPTGELSAAAQIEFDQEKIQRDAERQEKEAVEDARAPVPNRPNTTLCPSVGHTGRMFAFSLVKRDRVPRARSSTQRSPDVRTRFDTARRWPSGEMAGRYL